MATLTQHRSPNAGASTATSPATDQPFTPEMRDRQARGKNPYVKDSSTTTDEDAAVADWERGRYGSTTSSVRDDYHDRERKELAMAVLDRPEKLLMYAQANDDSIAGQRLAFMRALRGPLAEDQRGTNN